LINVTVELKMGLSELFEGGRNVRVAHIQDQLSRVAGI
jgi:hypothetical protein